VLNRISAVTKDEFCRRIEWGRDAVGAILVNRLVSILCKRDSTAPQDRSPGFHESKLDHERNGGGGGILSEHPKKFSVVMVKRNLFVVNE
jgi:hypothetical protein